MATELVHTLRKHHPPNCSKCSFLPQQDKEPCVAGPGKGKGCKYYHIIRGWVSSRPPTAEHPLVGGTSLFFSTPPCCSSSKRKKHKWNRQQFMEKKGISYHQDMRTNEVFSYHIPGLFLIVLRLWNSQMQWGAVLTFVGYGSESYFSVSFGSVP